MRLRGPVVLGLVLMLTAACAVSPERVAGAVAPDPVASLPLDPAATLNVLADRLVTKRQRFTVAIGDDVLEQGVADSPEHVEVSGESYVIRRLGPVMYFRLKGSALTDIGGDDYQAKVGTKWVHGRLPKGSELSVELGHDYPYAFVHTAAKGTALTKVDDHSISGLMPGSEKDGSHKFTAQYDVTNHLSELVINDRGEAEPLVITYTADDGPALAAPPASELADVSEDDYTLFLTLLRYE